MGEGSYHQVSSTEEMTAVVIKKDVIYSRITDV